MTEFAVWAPEHRRVELEIDGRRQAMRSVAGGWWRAEVPGTGAGTRYRYVLDGGAPRPDPRSPWQPDGIDGPSAVVEHGTYEWHDQHWKGARLSAAVIYELHIGTFTPEATFDGAIAKLDHLVDLGITAIEVMPIAEFSGDRGWGYDGVLLWAPHHAYGGPDGFKRLVEAAHARGLAVILDVVYNHLGPAGNYLGEFGPYFTDRYRTPWGSAVNFDGPGSDEVRQFVLGNALAWFSDYHVDGLRLDAVHAIMDRSALSVMEELAVAVAARADYLGRHLWLIAEDDRNDPALVRPREAGGFGLDACWDDDFHHALHTVLTGERGGYYEDFGTLGQLARAFEQVYVYGRDFSPFRNRHHGRPVGELPGTRFVGCLQNHDQIGNRALGERSGALMSTGRLRVGAALVLGAPLVPMLFQGEEWGASSPFQYFTDHRDPALGEAVSEGRRREFAAFGWSPDQVPDPQDRSTWSNSVLVWEEVDKSPHEGLLTWYRELIALRRRYEDLADGALSATSVTFDEDAQWFCVRRGEILIAANLAPEAQTLAVPVGVVLLASDPGVRVDGPEARLPADSVVIIHAG